MSVMELANLVSINDDCKTRIFDYLEYRDLVNIAETSTRLHTAVSDAFKRKYLNGTLFVVVPGDRGGSSYLDQWNSVFKDEAPDIFVWTRSLILKLLRNFGHILPHIHLLHEDTVGVHFGYYVEKYVAKYCSTTLTKLTLASRPHFLFNRDEPVQFVKVNCLTLLWNESGSSLSDDLPLPFNESFPNLYCLTLGTIVPPVAFPSVKHLIIKNKTCRHSKCSCEEVTQLLRLNPQLSKLKITNWDDKKCYVKLVKNIQDCLPELEALSLNHLHSDIDETFHFKNVTDFRLEFGSINQIPFTFEKLNRFRATSSPLATMGYCVFELSLMYSEFSRTVSYIFDFIAKNEHLKILRMSDLKFLTEAKRLTHMISALSNIEELTVDDDYILISSEDVHRLLTEMPSLKKLTLMARNLDRRFNDLEARISQHTKEVQISGHATYEVVFILN